MPLVLFGAAAAMTGTAVALVGPGSVWPWLAAVPLWFLISWVLWEAPRWAAMVKNRLRPCEQCGSSAWSRPDYGGFA